MMGAPIRLAGFDDAVAIVIVSMPDADSFESEAFDIPDRVPMPRRELAQALRRIADILEERAL